MQATAEEEHCRTAFFELCEELGLLSRSRAACDSAWKVLEERYSEDHRAYHTLSHISTLLSQTEEWKGEIHNYSVMRFAVFYHDVVYDALSSSNEEDSAALFSSTELGLNKAMKDLVVKFILATKSHSCSDDESESAATTRDLQLFLDLDMAVLGLKSLADYKTYCRQVRIEYRHLSDYAWAKGRARFIVSTLEPGAVAATTHIFHTPELRNRLEANARRNLRWELQSLAPPPLIRLFRCESLPTQRVLDFLAPVDAVTSLALVSSEMSRILTESFCLEQFWQEWLRRDFRYSDRQSNRSRGYYRSLYLSLLEDRVLEDALVAGGH